MNFELKGDQPQALDAVAKWWNTPAKSRKQVFQLRGGAGVGKTTVGRKLDEFARIHWMTLSGKASMVLKKKGVESVSTFHSAIYHVTEDEKGNLRSKLNPYSEIIRDCDIIGVDEGSMVYAKLGRDLESFGKPILVMGDPNQLQPPNGEDAYYTNQPADFTMREILRQAKDSPIIQLAYDALEGNLKVGKYGESEVFGRKIRDDKVRSLMLGADQVLCGKNATRIANNVAMRNWKGLEGSHESYLPVVGDRLICLRNNYEKGIFNGELFELTEILDKDLGRVVSFKAVSLDNPGLPMEFNVPWNYFNGTENNIPAYERANWDQFTYSYVLTTHKFQGSQADKVTVIDESSVFREQKRNHLYTSITRAAKSVQIF